MEQPKIDFVEWVEDSGNYSLWNVVFDDYTGHSTVLLPKGVKMTRENAYEIMEKYSIDDRTCPYSNIKNKP